jgi:hypothetical protein
LEVQSFHLGKRSCLLIQHATLDKSRYFFKVGHFWFHTYTYQCAVHIHDTHSHLTIPYRLSWLINVWIQYNQVKKNYFQDKKWASINILLKGKYYKEYMARYKKGDAGVPGKTINSTVYIRTQTVWRTLKLED